MTKILRNNSTTHNNNLINLPVDSNRQRTREMTQQIKAPAALSENLGSIVNAHMVICNVSLLNSPSFSGHLGHLASTWCKDIDKPHP